MRHRGNLSDYIEERNADLLKVYRDELSKCKVVVKDEICRKVANSPSRRFWVSEWRAAIVLSRMFNGDELESMCETETRRNMYREIYARALKIREKYPDMTMYMLAFNVVNQPAPSFYMTPQSVNVIIGRIKIKMRKKLNAT